MQSNGMLKHDSEPPHYFVEWSEPALLEADEAYLGISERSGPDAAFLWYEGLFEAGETLSSMPRIHPIAREDERYDIEVRRLLYYGPSKRRSGQIYRILFFIIEPVEDETEGVVRILHVWHGAKGPST